MSGAPLLGPAIAGLLFAGWCFATGPGARGRLCRPPGGNGSGAPTTPSSGRRPGKWWRTRRGVPGTSQHTEQFQQAAILVGQLAALLRAGRTPEQMWRQATVAHRPDGCNPGDPTGRVLNAAATAADLGRPVAPAMRTAAHAANDQGASAAAAIWWGVAACIETAEASGGALADVLERFAAQLEADADAAAARTVALAGPRATAQVLSVLPVAGLGLGMLMGADPFGVLLSTPLGALCLGLGAGLTAAGRWWSDRLVRNASEAR